MNQWHAEVTYEVKDLDDEQLQKLMIVTPGFATISHDNDTGLLRLNLMVEAGTVRKAVEASLRTASDATRQVLDKALTPTGVRVLSIAEQRAEIENPIGQDLVGYIEIADLLGVSRQRARQLAEENQQFPSPVARLAMGPVFTRSSVTAFQGRWERKSGRPKKGGGPSRGSTSPRQRSESRLLRNIERDEASLK
ncbi:hypothetical protein ACGFNU_00925 [Spirillospora sp. NPDC048911]|uniref:hypothetical protein n=1 Tax=Spirillospora sp. NPDC048911 TaxID=3364527 RepID=UPI0037128D4D